MKVILNKVNTRINATAEVISTLPEVFTKKMYEELRDSHVDMLWEKSGNPYEGWKRYIRRNEGAYTFDNLRDEGFMVLVKEEQITITVEVRDGYSYDVYDSHTDMWERWTEKAVKETAGANFWGGMYDLMAQKGYRIEWNPFAKKEIEAVRHWYRVSENLLDFLDERG